MNMIQHYVTLDYLNSPVFVKYFYYVSKAGYADKDLNYIRAPKGAMKYIHKNSARPL